VRRILFFLCLIQLQPATALGDEDLRNTTTHALIEKLASETYLERRNSQNELRRRGDSVIPHLSEAIKTSEDRNVRYDAQLLLEERSKYTNLSRIELYCLALEELMKDRESQLGYLLTASAMALLSNDQRTHLSKLSEQINKANQKINDLGWLPRTPDNKMKSEELGKTYDGLVKQAVEVYRKVFARIGAKLSEMDSHGVLTLSYRGLKFGFIYRHFRNEIIITAHQAPEDLNFDPKRTLAFLKGLGARNVELHDKYSSNVPMTFYGHPERAEATVIPVGLYYSLTGGMIHSLEKPDPECQQLPLPKKSPLPLENTEPDL
jgi:hypothetical protein